MWLTCEREWGPREDEGPCHLRLEIAVAQDLGALVVHRHQALLARLAPALPPVGERGSDQPPVATCLTRELRDDYWELISPHLPIGQCGPYTEHLRDQLEGIIWRFRTRGPVARRTGGVRLRVHRLRTVRPAARCRGVRRRNGGVIAEAARREQLDLSLVSVDSTTARAHHDAAGTVMGEEVLATLEKATDSPQFMAVPAAEHGGGAGPRGCRSSPNAADPVDMATPADGLATPGA